MNILVIYYLIKISLFIIQKLLEIPSFIVVFVQNSRFVSKSIKFLNYFWLNNKEPELLSKIATRCKLYKKLQVCYKGTRSKSTQ